MVLLSVDRFRKARLRDGTVKFDMIESRSPLMFLEAALAPDMTFPILQPTQTEMQDGLTAKG